jgi:hypothetical protein
VFVEGHHFNAGETGLTFLGILVGIGIALCLIPVNNHLYRKVVSERGQCPEARLPFMMFGGVLLPASLFIVRPFLFLIRLRGT